MISIFNKKEEEGPITVELFNSSEEGLFIYSSCYRYMLHIPHYTKVTHDKSRNSIYLDFSDVYDKFDDLNELDKGRLYAFMEALYQVNLGENDDYMNYSWLKNASNLKYSDPGIMNKIYKDNNKIETFIA